MRFLLMGILLAGSIGFHKQAVAQSAASKTAVNTAVALAKLKLFFGKIDSLYQKPANDNAVKTLLTDNLKSNKTLLKDWEIGLNNKDAQIWHLLEAMPQFPYVIDSSNKAKLICKLPFITNDGKVAGSAGILEIVPDAFLDRKNSHDLIQSSPDAQSKVLGKVKPGERYTYFPGTTGYSASLKKYVVDTYSDDGDGGNGFYAIVLDAAQHKLGYIISNATWLSFPEMQLQYLNGQWKIAKIAYR